MRIIQVGDPVIAVQAGGRDPNGIPFQCPEVGKIYRVTGIYQTKYGYGCELDGMDPGPYRGYLLYVRDDKLVTFHRRRIKPGWYFRRLEKASKDIFSLAEKSKESKPTVWR